MERQLQLFTERLPKKPYCTDNLECGLIIRSKIQAIEKRYIQPNGPALKYWMVIDVDRPGGGYDWEIREAPTPNIVAENASNMQAHLFYGLAVPVCTSIYGHLKPLRYAASVEHALVGKLGGDYGYAGLVAKNPLCKHWNVRTYEDHLYDLDWLSDYVDLEPYRDRRRHLPDYGLGRNCTLFERLRKWSYRAYLKVEWPYADAWHAAVLGKAAQYNDFRYPLPLSEIRSTAKSVARWVWKNFSVEEFSRIQAARARRLGEIRRAAAEKKRQLIFAFPGWTSSEIQEVTGIPAGTVRRLRSGPFTISDTSQRRDKECSRAISDNSRRGARDLPL
ncbi:hypothetical protein ES707_19743 [subsurface metagenome]